jgi:hypothetical protein
VKIRSLLDSTEAYKEHQSLSPGDNGSIEERIRQRAYELYEERGRHDGYHEEDWAQAEEQIRDQQTSTRLRDDRKHTSNRPGGHYLAQTKAVQGDGLLFHAPSRIFLVERAATNQQKGKYRRRVCDSLPGGKNEKDNQHVGCSVCVRWHFGARQRPCHEFSTSDVYSLGAPRQIEFGLRISF